MVKVFPFSRNTCNVRVQIILMQNDIEVWVGEDNPYEVGHTQQCYDKEHRLVRTYLRFFSYGKHCFVFQMWELVCCSH